ncbi:MAG TPA: hypothetical protein VN736_27540 [Candidatus Limnocylindrales bacterium]|nr:hypothetical protein [Candidatus Limnocylindrales bacterium]
MDWLEQELKEALRKQEPSPDFMKRPRRAPVAPVRNWLAAAAAVVLAVGAGGAYREYEGQVAKQKVMLAMRIAGSNMNHIQRHILEAQQ